VFTWHAGGVGVLVHILHVLHERLSTHTQLLAHWTTAGIGSSHQGRVFAVVRAQRGFGGEAFAADVAVKGPVLQAFNLGFVVPQVLLQVRQLDEGATAVGNVTTIRTFAYF